MKFQYDERGIGLAAEMCKVTEITISRPSGMPMDIWRQHARAVCHHMNALLARAGNAERTVDVAIDAAAAGSQS